MKDTALLLVDIQNDYLPGGAMELVGSREAALQAGEILKAARVAGIPVIHIQHLSTRPDATFFLPDTTGVLIAEAVKPARDESVIIKHYPNSFRETDLQKVLDTLGIRSLVVAGMMTHICIDTTVRAATDLRYSCTLISDATATRDLTFGGTMVRASEVQTAFLAALSGLFARVIPTAEILNEWG